MDQVYFPRCCLSPSGPPCSSKRKTKAKRQALRSLQALLLRCWTALPAGKARCTIIDPVGRGENFSAFMHLADFEEALVNSRIWTEPAHIDQRLTDLTTHMENVLQKYLRNQYETLAEYNAQAGEVAEPYRFLVVADFPVNFTPDAARRLLSLASAGARCGIYTFIMVDTKQDLPQGFDLADLAACSAQLRLEAGSFRLVRRRLRRLSARTGRPARCRDQHAPVADRRRRSQARRPRRGSVRAYRHCRPASGGKATAAPGCRCRWVARAPRRANS